MMAYGNCNVLLGLVASRAIRTVPYGEVRMREGRISSPSGFSALRYLFLFTFPVVPPAAKPPLA